MSSLFSPENIDLFSQIGLVFNERTNRSKKKGKRKGKKYDNWFESCTAAQLKELCKAAKLPVSGSKGALVRRLMGSEGASALGLRNLAYLKGQLKEKLLVQSGSKFDQVLRLLHHEHGTGAVKRAATETVVVDEATGEMAHVLKKRRKTTPKPDAMYARVEKKMNAVTQKKYQSCWGSKRHSADVYEIMKDLIVDHCIKERVVESDPLLAEEMARAVFRAFHDNWQVLRRIGYQTGIFREALDAYADVLKAARPFMTPDLVEEVVSLLESIEACVRGYCLHVRMDCDACVYYSTGNGTKSVQLFYGGTREKYGVPRYKDENVIEMTIRVAMPGYDRKTREEKKGKLLDCEVRAFAWMNGIKLPSSK